MQSPTPPTASSAPTNHNGGERTDTSARWLPYTLFAILAIGGGALDLWTKSWIFRRLGMPLVEQGRPSPPIWLIDGVFGFETSLNEGALFGVGQGYVVAFAALSIAAGIGIVLWVIFAPLHNDLHLTIALGCVMAGILGNLYDRLGLHGLTWSALAPRGHARGDRVYAVRDWLHFKIDAIGFDWPIFNLADSFLVCGAILLVWHALRFRD